MTDLGEGPEPTLQRFGWRELGQSVLGLGLAVALLAWGLPLLLDTSWAAITAQLRLVGWWPVLAMLVLLVGGLYSYTYTLSGSLPGLSHRRALMANAVSSTAGNVVPLGGPVGLALTYMMFRSWGFTRRNVSTSLVVTGVWNLLARIVLPVIGALAVVAGPIDAPRPVLILAVVAAVLGLLIISVCTLAIISDPVSTWLGTTLTKVARPFSAKVRHGTDLNHVIQDQRARTDTVIRANALQMSAGILGMFALFFCLYWVAARSVGMDLPVAELVAAYTFRQFLTVIAVTPGGLGITEVGTAGVLVAFGGDAGAASATALLYTLYAHGVVVPFGAAAWAGWWFGPKHQAQARAGQLGNDLTDR